MAGTSYSVVVHGHFYQPPRENPWTGSIETQPSAAPYHDWNERIHAECYRTVVAARVPGEEGRIVDIVNLLHSISFNFGPTLLGWLEEHTPDTYGAILEADRISRRRTGGHGNAMAQAYHHTILPLASRREKVTEVRWGIADFRRRFGREPEGMWLPETAVDGETLDVLAQEGITFTVVAPHQVKRAPESGMPCRYLTPEGRSIVLFPYRDALSAGVAFGSLLEDAEGWAEAIIKAGRGEEIPGTADGPSPDSDPGSRASEHSLPRQRLVTIATDGETYGHHHRFGEMALAAALRTLANTEGTRIENFSSFLARTPELEEVTLEEPSSWSCSHGVERWRADCGCKLDPSLETQQEWREPLRAAMDWLAPRLHAIYDQEGGTLFHDPWATRDRLGELASDDAAGWAELVLLAAGPDLSSQEVRRAGELLEMERNALRLFTSCGWFFDDLAGLEPVQVLRYAARALELAGSNGSKLKEGFLEILQSARTNEEPPRDGRAVFLEEVRSSHASSADGPSSRTESGQELVAAVRALDSVDSADKLTAAIERVRELADLHTSRSEPIPFEAQTRYFRILQKATPEAVAVLDSLREPLGFVPPS